MARGRKPSGASTQGALIGESALYAPTTRRVSARAAEDAVVMRIPRETFRRVLTEFPAGAAEIRAVLAARMRRLVDGLEATRNQIVRRLPRAETPGRAVSPETSGGLSSLRAPTSEDIDALARAAFERLPASFPAAHGRSGHPGRRFPRRRDAQRDGRRERL